MKRVLSLSLLLSTFVNIEITNAKVSSLQKMQQDADSSIVVRLTPSTEYQEMDCFGASGAWLGEVVGKYWDVKTKSGIAKLLFSTEIKNGQPDGIGLSHWRVNIGAGTAEDGHDGGIGEVRRTEMYLMEDGTYDWSRTLGQQYFMKKAREYGCNNFTLFSCTPPVYYTKNGFGYSSSGASVNLKYDKFEAFADYLATVAEFYENKGYNIRFISPVNEPQSNWDSPAQEGTGWQRNEIARIVRALNAKLTSKNLDSTYILLAEPSYWWFFNKDNGSGRGDLLWHFFSKESPLYIGNLKHVPSLVCSHSYGVDAKWEQMEEPREGARLTAEYFGIKKLYQSEWCMVPHGVPYEECPDINTASEIDLSLAMSKVIYHDLVTARVSAWFYWTALDQMWSNKNQYSLIYVTPKDGDMGDIKGSGGTYKANKNLWTLGNYSLFIRPGYRRIELANANTRELFATAFISPEKDKLIVVVTNCMNKSVDLKLDVTDESMILNQTAQYVTSNTRNLQGVTNDEFGYIQPRSVSTMIFNIK